VNVAGCGVPTRDTAPGSLRGMKHWHVVVLSVTGDGAGGRTFRVRQVDIDYATPEAAAEVLVELHEQQLGYRLTAAGRAHAIQFYAASPNVSTEPMTPDNTGDYVAIAPCEAAGEACIDTANAWGERKIAMRKALGLW
jgi:hypothetical protein